MLEIESHMDLYVSWYEEEGLNYTFIPFSGRSDYAAFLSACIRGKGGHLHGRQKKIRKNQDKKASGDVWRHCRRAVRPVLPLALRQH